MIDTESEPGAWARELAMQPRRCEHCRHYRYKYEREPDMAYTLYPFCALNHPLQPCADYEREPGADDGR